MDPQLVIRIAANIDAVRQAMSQAGSLIQTTTAGMQRMVTSFDGSRVTQQAVNMSAAIEKIGGVSKLTAAEMARANAVFERAAEKMTAMGASGAPAMQALAESTRKVDVATQGFASTLGGNLSTQLKATLLGFVSAQAIIGTVMGLWRTFTGFITSSVESFMAAESEQRKLTAALTAAGQATPGTIKQYNDLAATFQRTTVYSDDLINEMQALLVQVGGVMPSQMEGALKAATNLASGLGIDLRTATMLVGKAFEGETGTLKRYGIVIDEAKLKAEGLPAVLEAINSKFGGQAAAEMETTAGKLKLLANQWDNVKESVGAAIAQDPFVRALLENMTTGFDESTGAIERQDDAITQAALTTIPYLQTLRDEVDRLRDSYREAQEQADALAKATRAIPSTPGGLTNPNPGPIPIPPGTIQSLIDADKATKAATAALEAYRKSVQALADTWTKAAIDRELLKLSDALKVAAASGQLTMAGVEKLVAAYKPLRDQLGPNGLPKDLEAVYQAFMEQERITKLLERDFKSLAIAIQAITLPLARFRIETAGAVVGGRDLNQTLGVEMDAAMRRATVASVAATQRMAEFRAGITPATEATLDWSSSLTDLSRSFAELAQTSGGLSGFSQTVAMLLNVAAAGKAAGEQIEKAKASISKGWSGDGGKKDFGAIAAGILGMASAITSGIAAIDAVAQTGSKGAAILAGAMTGAQIGSAFGGWGAAIGAIGGAIYGLKAKAKEVKDQNIEATAEIQRMEAALVKTYGSMANIGVLGRIIGVDLASMWGSQATAGLAAFTAVQDQFVATMNQLQTALVSYGLTWRDLGAEMRQMNVTMTAEKLASDFKLLTDSGVDSTKAIYGMREGLSALIVDAIRTGTTIPPALQPILDQLIRSGELTDEAARAMLGLAESTLPSLADITAAAERYGIALDDLGPKVQQLRIDEAAAQLVADWDILRASTDDLGLLFEAMGGDVQQLVDDAMRYGAELPAAMKPMIQAFIDGGQLVDEFGNQITDINQLSFGLDMAAAVDLLIGRLDALITALGGVPPAVAAVAASAGQMKTEFADGVEEVSEMVGRLGDDLQAISEEEVNIVIQATDNATEVIEEISRTVGALPRRVNIDAEVAAAGFKTRAELEALAGAAGRVYRQMFESGRYTSTVLQQAFEAWQKALADIDPSPLDASAAAGDDTKKALEAAAEELASLNEMLAKEAPEEFMGSIERDARKRVEEIEAAAKAAGEGITNAAGIAAATTGQTSTIAMTDVQFASKGAVKAMQGLGRDGQEAFSDIEEKASDAADKIKNCWQRSDELQTLLDQADYGEAFRAARDDVDDFIEAIGRIPSGPLSSSGGGGSAGPDYSGSSAGIRGPLSSFGDTPRSYAVGGMPSSMGDSRTLEELRAIRRELSTHQPDVLFVPVLPGDTMGSLEDRLVERLPRRILNSATLRNAMQRAVNGGA